MKDIAHNYDISLRQFVLKEIPSYKLYAVF